jgi:hypothetical protein
MIFLYAGADRPKFAAKQLNRLIYKKEAPGVRGFCSSGKSSADAGERYSAVGVVSWQFSQLTSPPV